MNTGKIFDYKKSRSMFLTIAIFSIVNLFAITFSDRYFIFSSYFTQLIAYVGAELYIEFNQEIIVLIGFVGLGIVSIIPYVLCFILSKKRIGWQIAGIALFAIDSLLFLIDFVSLLSEGYYGGITDLIVRIVIIVMLVCGTIGGFKERREQQKQEPPQE
ncbi:MAG: hypothetical protein IJA82_01720 [Clostridia bacterium]|nr:hypothetical protein [Clostridia bacterium]